MWCGAQKQKSDERTEAPFKEEISYVFLETAKCRTLSATQRPDAQLIECQRSMWNVGSDISVYAHACVCLLNALCDPFATRCD